MTVVLRNNGTAAMTLDNPEQVPMLVVYDANMNPVGTWGGSQKPQSMRPPAGPITLDVGQSYSWTFQWNLSVHPSGGVTAIQQLSPAGYTVRAVSTVGLPTTIETLTSNSVRMTVRN